jgi:MFS family permease
LGEGHLATTFERAGRAAVSAYPALQSRNFRIYWAGMLVSLTGFWMQNLAQGWLVLELTDSPMMLGLVGAFFALPNLLLSLVGGVYADRLDRRRLLLVTRGVGALVSLSTAGLIATGLIQVWHVFAFAAVMGTVSAFDMPTSQALVPALVGPRNLVSGIALVSAAFNGTRIIGPSIAGIFVARFGIAGCYLIAAGATVVMLFALLMLRLPPTVPGASAGRMLDRVREGLDYVRRDDLRIAILGLILVNSLFGMSYPTLMPVFAKSLGGGSEAYGLLMAASGLGSLVGTLIVASLGGVRHIGRIILTSSTLFGLLLVAFSASPTLPIAAGLLAAVGLANATYSTLASTLLQARLDEAYRGRVMSVFTLAMSTMPLAGLQAGAIADSFGAPLAIAVNGAIVAAAGVLIAFFAPKLRRA